MDYSPKHTPAQVQGTRAESLVTMLPRVIGREAADKLFERFGGGERFRVPAGENNNKPGAARFAMLAQLIGRDNVLKLRAELGAAYVYMPTDSKRKIAARNLKIIADFNSGVSMDALMRQYNLTQRALERIVNQTPMPSRARPKDTGLNQPER